MVNLSQSLPTWFFEKKKDKNRGGGHEDYYEGGDGDNGKDDVAAAGYSSANDAVHRNVGAIRERKRAPYIPRKASLANFLIRRRRLRLYGGLENKIDEEDKNGGGDGDDGNNGGGRDDDKNGGGDGSGGNNKKESRDREGDGNGDKHGRSRRDWGGNTKGKNMDFMGTTGFGYRYGYHAGCENGYPVGQLKCAQEVQ